jgi:hypothetical protein
MEMSQSRNSLYDNRNRPDLSALEVLKGDAKDLDLRLAEVCRGDTLSGVAPLRAELGYHVTGNPAKDASVQFTAASATSTQREYDGWVDDGGNNVD